MARSTERRKVGPSLVQLCFRDQAVLHLDRATHRVDDAAELDDAAVASALNDAAVMGGDGRVDQIAAEASKTRKGPVFVGAGEPAVSDDVRNRYRPSFLVSLIAQRPCFAVRPNRQAGTV